MSVQEAESVEVARHRFTVAEYERMGRFGIFSEDKRVELVYGEVVNLPEERIEVYSDPAGGEYRTARSYARGRRLQSHTLAALRLSVSKALG